MRRQVRLRSLHVLFLFVAAAAILPWLLIAPNVLTAAKTESDRRVTESLQTAAGHVASRLTAELAQQWREHAALARIAAAEGIGPALAMQLNTVKAVNNRLAWIGMAAPDGRLVLAAGRSELGPDVSAQPWFRAGLQGAFASDQQDAGLRVRSAPREASVDSPRLIDFALPVHRFDGSTMGVLASRLDIGWAQQWLQRALQIEGADVMLINRDGTVLAGPSGLEGRRPDARVFLSARQGFATATTENWADGASYFSVAQPVTAGEGVPSLGWSIIVRQSRSDMLAIAHPLAKAVMKPLLVASSLLLIAGWLLASRLAQPLRELAWTAATPFDSRLGKPMPELLAAEASILDSALIRLDQASRLSVEPLRQAA